MKYTIKDKQGKIIASFDELTVERLNNVQVNQFGQSAQKPLGTFEKLKLTFILDDSVKLKEGMGSNYDIFKEDSKKPEYQVTIVEHEILTLETAKKRKYTAEQMLLKS